MSKSSALVLFVLAVVALGDGLRSCRRQFTEIKGAKELWETWEGRIVYGMEHPFPDATLCTNKKYPFCVLSNQGTNSYIKNNDTTYEYSCVECRTDCDCPIGKYCSNINGINVKDFGRCVSYSSIVGKKCDPRYPAYDSLFENGFTDSQSQGRDIYYNPDKYCAVVKTIKQINNEQDPLFNVISLNSSVYSVEFQGACVLGTCRECNSLLTYKSFERNAERQDSSGGYPFFNSMGRCKPSNYNYAPWYYKFSTYGSMTNQAHVSQYKTKPRYCHNFKYHYLNQDDV